MEKDNSEKSTPPLTQNSKMFSLEQLNRIGNNDKVFTAKMLEKFIQSATECSETMTMALSQNDWKKIKTVAHKSIPSYSLLGLNGFVKDLAYIENYADNPLHNKDIDDLIKKVERKNKEIIRDIWDCVNELKQN
jgi:HPt (histidine-containing phosphotransfer) domain-containing protein